MKRRNLSALLLMALAFPPFADAAQSSPDFTLPTAEGEVALPTLHSRVIYLDFWASWCTHAANPSPG
jgi:thiol-disulfide isomerase/thioredoxin